MTGALYIILDITRLVEHDGNRDIPNGWGGVGGHNIISVHFVFKKHPPPTARCGGEVEVTQDNKTICTLSRLRVGQQEAVLTFSVFHQNRGGSCSAFETSPRLRRNTPSTFGIPPIQTLQTQRPAVCLLTMVTTIPGEERPCYSS